MLKRYQAFEQCNDYGSFLWRDITEEKLLGGKIRINHLILNIHLFLSRSEQILFVSLSLIFGILGVTIERTCLASYS